MPDFDPASVTFARGHYIGGAASDDEAERIAVARPSDLRPYADLPVAGPETVDRAVRDAEAALTRSGWATRPPRERARAMRRWADLIESRAEDLGRLEALGSTRPIAQVVSADVAGTAEGIRFFSEWADKLGGEVAATRTDHLGLVVTEPYGVVGAITPWNFPLSMASWKVGPALAAGNAIVLKPSELTPFSTVRLAELAVEAGIPAGIFNVVQGTGAVTGTPCAPSRDRQDLLHRLQPHGSRHHDGRRAGRDQAGHAGTRRQEPAARLRRRRDLDGRRCIAGSLLANAGQACVAGSRLIVQRPVRDELLEGLMRAARRPRRRARPGGERPPSRRSSRGRRRDRIDAHRGAKAAQEGAELLLGGGGYRRAGGRLLPADPARRTSRRRRRPCARRSSGLS